MKFDEWDAAEMEDDYRYEMAYEMWKEEQAGVNSKFELGEI